MIAFPSMLLKAAEDAGIKVPDLSMSKNDEFDNNIYPHFAVFCNAQLCRRMSNLAQHWENAKIIAQIPDDKIKTITEAQ